MKNELIHVTHESIPIFINDDSRLLILGSLPSVKSREDGFYYAHKQNRFFKVLAALFNEDEPISIDDRKEFLLKHHIALYDVIYECDIVGSSDSSIINAKTIDIVDILNRYPLIKCIAINGGKAKELFNRYLLPKINTRDIKIYYLPSTSPANARTSLSTLIDQYSLLKSPIE